MNLILLEQSDFTGYNRVKLTGRRHRHALEILNATAGKELRVGLVGGKLGAGIVISTSRSALELEVQLVHAPPSPLPVNLVLAMPRPKVFKRVLQGVTAMGVKKILLVNSWRVDKSYWQSPALEPENLREQLILGLEQARDTMLPDVQLEKRFKPFVEDRLPGLLTDTRAFVAHPGVSQPCPADIRKAITLAIGPEGGFTPYEVDQLVAAGMTPIHLGARALRVETAVPALLGRLMPCI